MDAVQKVRKRIERIYGDRIDWMAFSRIAGDEDRIVLHIAVPVILDLTDLQVMADDEIDDDFVIGRINAGLTRAIV